MSFGFLKFKLPEEREEFLLAQRGGEFKYALDEMDNYLRNRLKHEDLSKEDRETLLVVRIRLNEIMKDLE